LGGFAAARASTAPTFNHTLNRPGEQIEESIAEVQYVATRKVWYLFWKQADGKWHRYKPCPEADSLSALLRTIDEDAHCCFFG